MKINFSEHTYNEATPLKLIEAGFDVVIPKEEITDVHEYDRVSLLNDLIDTDVLVVGLRFKIDKEVIDKISKAIFTQTTGLDLIDLNYCKEKNIEVISLRGSDLSDLTAVSELSFGMLIYMMRTFEKPGYELRDKNLAVIGRGRIGTHMSKLGVGMGMKVAHNDPRVEGSIELEKLLNWAHVVSLNITADESNRGFLKYHHFEMMKQCPFVLNASRQWLIEDSAVQRALDNGLISGFWSDFPLNFKHKHLICTNHVGGSTHESLIKSEIILVDKIINYENNTNGSGRVRTE